MTETVIDAYKSQLEWLREKYRAETDPEYRKALIADAEQLKAYHGCYECKENARPDEEDDLFPFCSIRCKELWGEKNYGKKKDGRPVYDVPEMMERLKQMGKKEER